LLNAQRKRVVESDGFIDYTIDAIFARFDMGFRKVDASSKSVAWV